MDASAPGADATSEALSAVAGGERSDPERRPAEASGPSPAPVDDARGAIHHALGGVAPPSAPRPGNNGWDGLGVASWGEAAPRTCSDSGDVVILVCVVVPWEVVVVVMVAVMPRGLSRPARNGWAGLLEMETCSFSRLLSRRLTKASVRDCALVEVPAGASQKHEGFAYGRWGRSVVTRYTRTNATPSQRHRWSLHIAHSVEYDRPVRKTIIGL